MLIQLIKVVCRPYTQHDSGLCPVYDPVRPGGWQWPLPCYDSVRPGGWQWPLPPLWPREAGRLTVAAAPFVTPWGREADSGRCPFVTPWGREAEAPRLHLPFGSNAALHCDSAASRPPTVWWSKLGTSPNYNPLKNREIQNSNPVTTGEKPVP